MSTRETIMIDATEVPIEVMLGWAGLGPSSGVVFVCSEIHSPEMEKGRSEKMQVREKVGKSRNTVFFQCFVAPEGRKVGSLKRRVRRHLGR